MTKRSNINLNAYATLGENVGTGTTVFIGKCDLSTLQFKTLSVVGSLSVSGDSENIILSGSSGSGVGINVSGSTVNGITTYINSETICSQPNLTFNGNVLSINGKVYQSGLGCSTFFGYQAGLNDDSTLNRNSAFGYHTLCANTSGSYNVAVAYQALYKNTTGVENVAIGSLSLRENTLGTSNVAIGHGALNLNTIGGNNVAVGHLTNYNNTTGNNNVVIGRRANYSNTTGCNNVSVGYNAHYNSVSGCCNTVIGDSALNQNITGCSNVAIGYCAGYTEIGSNKLHIANCRDCTLIYGEFDNKIVCTCGIYYPGSYTNAGIPPASSHTGGIAYISDSNWMVWSNGTNWMHFSGGTAI